MKLKRALQITIALRDAVVDPRLKRSISYVLNDDINRAFDVWICDFSSPDSFPNFFLIEMIYNNLKSDCEGANLIDKIPNCIKNGEVKEDPKNALEKYQRYYIKASEGIFMPETALEKYICCLFGYRWRTHVDKDIINFYYAIQRKLDFSEICNDNSMNT